MNGVGFRIGAIHAFVAVHSDDDEGIVGIPTIDGILPAIAADKQRLDELRPLVERLSKSQDLPIKLVRFDQRTDVETIE